MLVHAAWKLVLALAKRYVFGLCKEFEKTIAVLQENERVEAFCDADAGAVKLAARFECI